MTHAEIDEHADRLIAQKIVEMEKSIAEIYGICDVEGLEELRGSPFLAKFRKSYKDDLIAAARSIAYRRHIEAEEQRKQQSRKEKNYGSW